MTIDYFENKYATTRAGQGGVASVSADGVAGFVFDHYDIGMETLSRTSTSSSATVCAARPTRYGRHWTGGRSMRHGRDQRSA